MLDPLLSYLPTVLYALALVVAVVDLVWGAGLVRVLALVLLALAVVARTATFLEPGLCPVSAAGSGSGLVALFLALNVCFGFRAGASSRVRTTLLLGVILLADVAGQLLSPDGTTVPPPARERVLGEIHGGLVLLAYAAFAVGAVYCFMYVTLYRLMKRRRLGFWFARMPALSRLESRAGVANLVGLVTLTVGLSLGMYSFHLFRGGLPVHDPKFQVALLVWALFAGEVVCRRWLKWSGIRVMWVPLVGALLLVVLISITGTDHPFWSPLR